MNADFDRSNSRAMWGMANAFFQSSRILQEREPYSRVAYYLVCHAIELLFKAFLRGKGESLLNLKKLNHHLVRCHDAAASKGLATLVSLNKEELIALAKANKYYASKELEYGKYGFRNLPEPELLAQSASRLLDCTKQFCSETEELHSGTATADSEKNHAALVLKT